MLARLIRFQYGEVGFFLAIKSTVRSGAKDFADGRIIALFLLLANGGEELLFFTETLT